MKNLYWITALMLFSLFAMPVCAQRPGGKQTEPRGMGPGRISGKVIAVNTDKNIVKVALYIRVANPNAPGKVPEEIAQIAARLSGRFDELSERASQLRQRGKDSEAEKYDEMASEIKKRLDDFKCWREVEAMTSPSTLLSGIIESSINDIRLKTLVTFFSYAEGPVATGTNPGTLVLIGPVRTAGEKERPFIARSRSGPASEGNAADRTYFRIAGVVAGINPLVLNVNGASIQILNPKGYPYTHRETIAIKDIKPGLRIVQTDLGKNEDVKDIRALLINMNPNASDREE